jgi:DNA adenine methylase
VKSIFICHAIIAGMKSAFAWPGGKRALTPTLLKLIPEHSIYVEVFAGSAKLLFAKTPTRFEILNDLNGDVTNFFRVVKHRASELAERLEMECIHAGRFRELREQRADAATLCEVDRALRFAYLAWYSFGAKGEHFASVSANSPKCKRPLTRVRELLSEVAVRLGSVSIEQRDFAEILRRYDSAESFFYLDPPYVEFQANGRYRPLPKEKRDELFELLTGLQGKFLLSFDDHPEIRKRARAAGFHTRAVKVQYTLAPSGSTRNTPSPELLVSNYKLVA